MKIFVASVTVQFSMITVPCNSLLAEIKIDMSYALKSFCPAVSYFPVREYNTTSLIFNSQLYLSF